MQHFFVTPDQVGDKEIWITGADVNHICNVLRGGRDDEGERQGQDFGNFLYGYGIILSDRTFPGVTKER